MAQLVHLDRTVAQGLEVYSALTQIRNGLGKLEELDGLRAEAIGQSATIFAAVFGTNDATEAQALSDRWATLLSAYGDSGNTEFEKLRIILNTFLSA